MESEYYWFVSPHNKVLIMWYSNTFHPLGALLFSNGTYKESLKIIDASGVPAVTFMPGQTWDYNYTTGVTVKAPPITASFAQLVGQEFQRYAQYWATVFAPYSALRYKVSWNTAICQDAYLPLMPEWGSHRIYSLYRPVASKQQLPGVTGSVCPSHVCVWLWRLKRGSDCTFFSRIMLFRD